MSAKAEKDNLRIFLTEANKPADVILRLVSVMRCSSSKHPITHVVTTPVLNAMTIKLWANLLVLLVLQS
jgi:hypothetical protein